MNVEVLYRPLYVYLVTGFFLWGLMYIAIPAKPTYGYSILTFSYLLLSLTGFFLGYFFTGKFHKIKGKQKVSVHFKERVIWVVIVVVCLSWIIRYIDVFCTRGISFYNTVQENRLLMGSSDDNIIFIFGAIFKELFFLPLVLTLSGSRGNKKMLWISILLFAFPLIVPFLRGTRKDVFLTVLFFILAFVLTKKVTLRLKTILTFGVVLIVLINVVFYNLLIGRITNTSTTEEQSIDYLIENAHYNKLLEPSNSIKEKVISANGLRKAVLFNSVHVLQYYCHGLFELDYLVLEKSEKKNFLKGQYSFNLFFKALGKFNFIKYDEAKIGATLPRSPVYITFFGALFVDFGWYGAFVMMFLGYYQRRIDINVKNGNVYYLGLYMFFILFNLFIPVINLLRGTGVYFVFSSLIILFFVKIISNKKIKSYLRL